MARVYLLTGGNTGKTEATLRRAQRMVNSNIGVILHASGIYKTLPWGFNAEGLFYNQALEVDTDLSPEEVLDEVQIIERTLGRDRQREAMVKRESGEAYASRPIDIDIIFYDDIVMETPLLTIPHPRMHERSFVLTPLGEIAPEKVHPLLHKTVGELMDELRDKEMEEQKGK